MLLLESLEGNEKVDLLLLLLSSIVISFSKWENFPPENLVSEIGNILLLICVSSSSLDYYNNKKNITITITIKIRKIIVIKIMIIVVKCTLTSNNGLWIQSSNRITPLMFLLLLLLLLLITH